MAGVDEDQADELDPTPLEMARNCAAAVVRSAKWSTQDPVGSYINQSGTRAFEAAQLGSYLALVSIAESLDRIAALLGEARL